jgi:hypothetical protein
MSSDGATVAQADTSLPSTPSEGSQIPSGQRFSHQDTAPMSSRADWIREWMRLNPGRPAPCSAKSIYRIADRKLPYCRSLFPMDGPTQPRRW